MLTITERSLHDQREERHRHAGAVHPGCFPIAVASNIHAFAGNSNCASKIEVNISPVGLYYLLWEMENQLKRV